MLRRLRSAATTAQRPAGLFASATVGEPAAPSSALCRPSIIDEHTGTRLSAHTGSAAVLATLVRSGCRAIAFCRSRRATGRVAAQTQRRVGAALALSVRAYRASCPPAEWREIEAELVSGRLRAGRAGRGTGRSLAVLEAGPDQLDQWFLAHPQPIFSRLPQPAVVYYAHPDVAVLNRTCPA